MGGVLSNQEKTFENDINDESLPNIDLVVMDG